MQLVDLATGELADAIHRDLLTDRLAFDDLGWRGLWAYIAKAPPLTAIYQDRTDGLSPSDELTLELINELREINWRYTAIHFEGGKETPFPQRITRQTLKEVVEVGATWETVTIDELISPEVRALLQS